MSSIYDPVWERLKALPKKEAASRGVSINAPRHLHARILKAVVKRKWLDVGFKLAVSPAHATLTHASKGVILTFFLTYSICSDDF